MKEEKKQEFFQKKKTVILGALIATLLWGSAFPCIKVGYQIFAIAAQDTASQILFAGIRFALAGLLTILFGSILSKRFLRPQLKSLPKITALSLAQTIGQYIFFYVGLARTTAVNGSIISGCTALFVIVGSCMIFRYEKMSRSKALGCIFAVLGLIVVNLPGLMGGARIHLLGDLLMLISTISSATSSVLVKLFTGDEDPIMLSGYQFLLGGVVMAVAGIASHGSLGQAGIAGGLLLVYMALISAVAYTIWSILIKYNNVSRISAFSFLIPILGSLLSAIFLGADSGLGLITIVALALVSAGIFFINRTKHTQKGVEK